MKVVFKHIHIENFLSFGNADFEIDNSGYVLVSGRNSNINDSATSNGSGKSALFDAILWCLTGETVRGSKDVVNLFGNDGAVVEVDFSIDKNEFKVTRSKNHSKYKSNLIVIYNGNNVSGKGIRDTEKILESYLGELNSSIIGSVIILGQGLPQRFTNNTPSARKEILEKLSNSDFMIEDLKQRVSKRKSELLSLKREQEDSKLSNQVTINLKRQELQKLVDNPISQDKIDALEKDVSNLDSKISELTVAKDLLNSELVSKSLELDIQQENYDKLTKVYYQKQSEVDSTFNSKLMELNNDKAKLQQEYRTASNEITKIDNMRDTCPTCGQKLVNFVRPDKTPFIQEQERVSALLINVDSNIQTTRNEYNTAKQEAEKLFKDTTREALEKLQEIKKYIREKSEEEQELVSKRSTLERDKSSSETMLKTFKENIVHWQDNINQLKVEIEKLDETILYINNEIDEISDRLSIVNNMETLLKRDFRGILLESVIKYIDSKVKEFAEVVFDNRNVSFMLDGNAISIKLNDKEYENLSGGEKQKVDLIIQFAIRSMLVMQTGFSCNMLVLDEIFDNLDSTGSERVLDLISAKLNDVENIFIVTHHSSIPIPYDKEVIIQKGDDNLSVIV